MSKTPLSHEEPQILKVNVTAVSEPTLFDSALLKTVNKTNDIYSECLKQSKRSFTASLSFVTIGILIFVTVIMYYILVGASSVTLFAASAMSIITELIGGTIFVVHARSIEQLSTFGEKMSRVYETMLAANITQDISDNEIRDSALAYIAKTTASREPIPDPESGSAIFDTGAKKPGVS